MDSSYQRGDGLRLLQAERIAQVLVVREGVGSALVHNPPSIGTPEELPIPGYVAIQVERRRQVRELKAVSDDPILEEYQSFFMEQVFSAAHDEDMVSTYELSAYRNSIAELLFRADIVRDSKPKASYIADLGFRTSNKVLSEFHFVDYELSNAE